MSLFAESENKIYADIIYDVVLNTNITRSSPGSKARALVEAVSRRLGKMWAVFDLNLAQAFVDGAHGQYLDFIGHMMGTSRLGAQPASISSLDRLVKFYVDAGTFRTINSGGSILLPAGTIISTGDNASGIRYKIILSTILPSDESEAYVSVESLSERFELYAAGLELANGFSELTDATEQRRRLEEERALRLRLGRPAYPIDERFLEAVGRMPDAGGVALGVDRLLMLLAGAPRIRDVLLFPAGDFPGLGPVG